MRPARFIAVVAAGVLALSLSGPAVGAATKVPAEAPHSKGADSLVLLNCVGNSRIDFDPGLQLYPQRVTIRSEGTLSLCLPNAHNIANGTYTVRATGTLDCLVGGGSEGFFNIEWVRANGTVAHSVAEFPLIAFTVRSTGQTIVVVTARIVRGLFAGHLLVHEGVLLQFNVERCLLGLGVHTVSGPTNFTII